MFRLEGVAYSLRGSCGRLGLTTKPHSDSVLYMDSHWFSARNVCSLAYLKVQFHNEIIYFVIEVNVLCKVNSLILRDALQ